MPEYDLGNGNDTFNAAFVSNWSSGSSVYGGNGDDFINTQSPVYGSDNNLYVDGGNGDDTIRLYGSNSVAFGNNGDDTLTSTGGLGNTLSGGNGDDTLISLGGGSGMGPGNTLTGGLGQDTFILVNSGNLVVTNDAAGSGVVADGDVFVGPMDVITDYTQGEHIGLRSFDPFSNNITPTDAALSKIDSVALAPDPLPHTGDSFRPVVGSGQYAVLHGAFGGANSFIVNGGGPDLLVVYDTSTGPTDLVGKGSLVLLGVTDPQLVTQALSEATAPGASNGLNFADKVANAMSFDANNSSKNSAVASGVWNIQTSGSSAFDLVPHAGSFSG